MEELARERALVKDALAELKIDAWIFEEDAGARPQSAQSTFRQELERADLYLGIFWNRLGQYTRDEFELAQILEKDSLLYEKRSGIEGRREMELERFLERVGDVTKGLTVKHFESAEELGELVKLDLARWQADKIRRNSTYRIQRPQASARADNRRALESLLRKVRQFWIEGVLESSVHGEALLEPAKETWPDAVASPWERILELPDQTRRPISAAQPLGELFSELRESLLVLGAPGSGKTITLLQLARELLDRAEQRPEEPVPVVFNLSTWSEAGDSLRDWLIAELNSKYQIPARIGRAWIDNQQLLPMLDGLDEVATERRDRCAQAINEFAEEVGVPGIAVCCRLEEYEALAVRLKLGGAVHLQPLVAEEVLEQLRRAGPSLSALTEVLEREAALQELAQSPLMLDVMMLAFRDWSGDTGESSNVESWRQHIFGVYTQRMFARSIGRGGRYSQDRIIGSLERIAAEMMRRAQTIFLIEDLQPSALATRVQRAVHVLASRLAGGLLFSLLLGSSMALGFWNEEGGSPPLSSLLRDELSLGVITGLLFGLSLGVLDFTCLERRGVSWNSEGRIRYLGLLVPSLAFCAAASVSLAIVSVSDEDVIGPTMYVLGGGATCLIWGRRWLRQSLVRDIRSVESLSWSWRLARLGSVVGLAAGLAVAALMLTSMWPLTGGEMGLIPQLLIINGLGFSFVGLLFGGLRTGTVEMKSKPNQGMHLSLRNSLVCFLGGTVVVAAGIVLIFALGTGLAFLMYPESLGKADDMPELGTILLIVGSKGLAAGLFIGTCASLLFGGLELLHHAVLRSILFFGQGIPLRLGKLLDQARDLILLRTVGGGYIFIHRLLLEYFAGRQRADQSTNSN